MCAAGTYLGISVANVSCSGGCTCTPSTNTASGTISDGPGNYVNDLNCQWIIASDAVIQMSFTSFSTEFDYDFVTVNRCTSPSCNSVEQVAELSGSGKLSGSSVSTGTTYSSLTGYLQLVFTTDESGIAPGFVGSWSITRNVCLQCTAGEYSTQEGSERCQTCPSASYSPAGSSVCTTCPAGTYSVGPTVPCSLCGGGTYTESEGSSTCRNCETGKYGTVLGATGSTPCTFCAAGTYLGISLANLSCSGGCPCTPSTNTVSGTISDGPGNYVNDLNCQWIIASDAVIQMSFTSFSTEFDYDFVTVNRCTSPSCSSVQQVAKLSGNSVSAGTNYSSLTGYLQLVFTSDNGVTRPGFVGSWSITRNACLQCTAGKYSGKEGSERCQTCPSGSYSPVGSSACATCPAGTYSVGPTVPCSLCGGGTYAEAEGSSTCTNCETGKYATVLGATAPSVCLTCPTRNEDAGCSSSSVRVSDVWCVDPSSSDWVSAVLCAPDNHTIVFAPGVYKAGCGVTLTRNLRLESARSGSATLDCEGDGRHFVLGAGTSVVIDGLVLTKGRAALASFSDGHGGCIFAQGNSSLVLRNTTFTHCIADKSGGALVLAAGASASVTGSTIENCSASDSGGVAVHNGSRLDLQDSRIERNTAASCGGGLFLQVACNATVARSTVAGNRARDYGGGLFGRDRVQVLVESSTLELNFLTSPSVDILIARGGGIYVDIDSTLRIASTTISRNTAGNRGGEHRTHILLNISPPEHHRVVENI